MVVSNIIQLSDVRSGFRIDAEFYRQEYLKQDRELSLFSRMTLGSIANVTDGEHGSVRFVRNGIRYLTAENVKQGYIEHENVRYVDSEVDQRNSRARVRDGDVLISIKGTLGEVGLAEKSLLPANMNRDVAIIKLHSNTISGAYLTPFLRSRFGAYQLAREGSGGVQQMITLERLRCIQIPLLTPAIRNEVAELHERGLRKRQESIALYNQAQHILESVLGLDQLNFQKPVGYIAQFSELERSLRSDAQYYQPRFTELLNHLAAFPTTRVRQIRTCNRRGFQPSYVENGTVDVVNSQHLGQKHIDYEGLQKTSPTAFAAVPEGHVKANDLLIYTTGAYIGRTNAYLSDKPALASNHVNILRLTTGIDAAYMALVFQSVIGQFQTQKHARGSAQAELYPTDIDKFVVPLIDPSKQKSIGDLVRESLEKQQEARRLLDLAKSRVEQLIEEAVNHEFNERRQAAS